MTAVERVRVGEVLRLVRRPVEVDPTMEYREIGVRSFGKGIFHKEPVVGADLGNKRVFRIEPDDLVISNVFAWEGAIALAGDDEAGMIGSHRFMTFKPKSDRISIDWARWFFCSEMGLGLVREASPGSAGRNRTLAISRFEAIEIPLPEVADQVRVASTFDKVFGDSDELSRLHETAGKLRMAAGPSICVAQSRCSGDGVRTPLKAVMVESSERVQVEPQSAYGNLGIYSFGRGVFPKSPISGSKTSASWLHPVKPGQFIYSRLFAFEGAYASVPEDFHNYFVSNEFPSFDVDPSRLSARWLAYHLSTPLRWEAIGAHAQGLGGRRQRVPVPAVLNHEIALPPIEQQLAQVALADGVQDRNKAYRTRELVDALRHSALNKAFGHFS